MKIFFDLDGTLIDSKPRLYFLFQHLIPTSKLTFEEYWILKKEKISHKEILKNLFDYTDEQFQVFNDKWMELIESPQWLKYDRLIADVIPFLETISKNHDLYVVTARQSEIIAKKQIQDLGLHLLFKDILVTLQKTEKADLIKNKFDLNTNDWIVGDTGKDIQTGKILGIKSAAVLSGFLSEKQLITYFPDIILSNVTELNF